MTHSYSWTLLYLQRQERRAKVIARRKGKYIHAVWGVLMNERIDKLAVQAGAVNVWEWASDDVLDTKSMDAEVRECADIALTEAQSNGNFDTFNKIVKHFGVSV
jgi:predicted metal-dependent HD superfamily phosphohydrolase